MNASNCINDLTLSVHKDRRAFTGLATTECCFYASEEQNNRFRIQKDFGNICLVYAFHCLDGGKEMGMYTL